MKNFYGQKKSKLKDSTWENIKYQPRKSQVQVNHQLNRNQILLFDFKDFSSTSSLESSTKNAKYSCESNTSK